MKVLSFFIVTCVATPWGEEFLGTNITTLMLELQKLQELHKMLLLLLAQLGLVMPRRRICPVRYWDHLWIFACPALEEKNMKGLRSFCLVELEECQLNTTSRYDQY